MTVPQRLSALRSAMAAHGLRAYIVPTADHHGSEYVAPHFRFREYLSGFTGSAGTLLVTLDAAWLWTDGRYFTQAAAQLEGSGITLMREGERDVPELGALLSDVLLENDALGFDGRTMDAAAVRALMRTLADKSIDFVFTLDLAAEVWPQRPALPDAPIWLLGEEYAGESAQSKLAWLRADMQERGADVCVLCDPTNIAWLLNLRGGDCAHTPAPLCFCFVEREDVYLFIDEARCTMELHEALLSLGVVFRPYAGVLGFACRYEQGVTAMLTAARVNYALWDALSDNVILLDVPDVVSSRKAVKNAVELKNLREAHIMDGVALTRFMHWLKKSVGKSHITELSAAARLDAERLEQDACLGLSFDTICGCGPHAAIIHYSATPQTDVPLEPHGLLLVDSGAQYYQGTTDVTRTYALGPITDEERRHCTLVLKGMLALMDARFLESVTGVELDTLARAPLWAEGLDYRHGTGHGIGYLLSVHEDPVRINRKAKTFTFAPGMVVSDEPGIYIEASHGVRIENQLVCLADRQNEYGSFLRFAPLTLSPIDLDTLDTALLSPHERALLNAYHQSVYEALEPHFGGEMKLWLREATRPI